jgi:hypothetical protein
LLATLAHNYGRPVLIEKKAIRAGVKKLLARWQREAEASRRYWAKRFPK